MKDADTWRLLDAVGAIALVAMVFTVGSAVAAAWFFWGKS